MATLRIVSVATDDHPSALPGRPINEFATLYLPGADGEVHFEGSGLRLEYRLWC